MSNKNLLLLVLSNMHEGIARGKIIKKHKSPVEPQGFLDQPSGVLLVGGILKKQKNLYKFL